MKAMDEEYAAWRELNAQLKATGAVTEADGKLDMSDRSTPGTRLYAQIRLWGDRLVVLREHQAKQKT